MLPLVQKRTELLLAGHSKVEVIAAIKAAFEKKELPALEPGAVPYMMAESSSLTDNGGHNGPHHVLRTNQEHCSQGCESPQFPCYGGEFLVFVRAVVSPAPKISSHNPYSC
jgi:hypothetical protein